MHFQQNNQTYDEKMKLKCPKIINNVCMRRSQSSSGQANNNYKFNEWPPILGNGMCEQANKFQTTSGCAIHCLQE